MAGWNVSSWIFGAARVVLVVFFGILVWANVSIFAPCGASGTMLWREKVSFMLFLALHGLGILAWFSSTLPFDLRGNQMGWSEQVVTPCRLILQVLLPIAGVVVSLLPLDGDGAACTCRQGGGIFLPGAYPCDEKVREVYRGGSDVAFSMGAVGVRVPHLCAALEVCALAINLGYIYRQHAAAARFFDEGSGGGRYERLGPGREETERADASSSFSDSRKEV